MELKTSIYLRWCWKHWNKTFSRTNEAQHTIVYVKKYNRLEGKFIEHLQPLFTTVKNRFIIIFFIIKTVVFAQMAFDILFAFALKFENEERSHGRWRISIFSFQLQPAACPTSGCTSRARFNAGRMQSSTVRLCSKTKRFMRSNGEEFLREKNIPFSRKGEEAI